MEDGRKRREFASVAFNGFNANLEKVKQNNSELAKLIDKKIKSKAEFFNVSEEVIALSCANNDSFNELLNAVAYELNEINSIGMGEMRSEIANYCLNFFLRRSASNFMSY
jgi:hypothetical protein